jgi:hypothetical protein
MRNKFLGLLFGLTVSVLGTTRSDAANVTFQGVFNLAAPTPTCSSTDVCNGLGTSTFNFGDPILGFNTELAFTGRTYPSVPVGDFNLGTLRVTNGAIRFGTFPTQPYNNGAENITFINLRASDTDNTKAGDFIIGYNSTANNDPIVNSPANADFVYFPRNPEFGAFYILEGSTLDQAVASVDILALDPPAQLFLRGFQTVPGQTNGFIGALPSGSIDPTTGYFIPSSTGFTPVPTATSVPEPFTIIGTFIGGTAALRLRKKLKDPSV